MDKEKSRTVCQELSRWSEELEDYLSMLRVGKKRFNSGELTKARKAAVIVLNSVSYALGGCINMLKRDPIAFLKDERYVWARPERFEKLYLKSLEYCQYFSTSTYMFDVVLMHERWARYDQMYSVAVEKFGYRANKKRKQRKTQLFWCLQFEVGGKLETILKPAAEYRTKKAFLEYVFGLDLWVEELESVKNVVLYQFTTRNIFEPTIKKVVKWELTD